MMPPDKAACKAFGPKWIDTSPLDGDMLFTIVPQTFSTSNTP
jgi:hypothetical protein